MKTLEDQMSVYAAYHQDARNKATHFVGVPVIVLALMVPLSWPRFEGVSAAMVITAALLAKSSGLPMTHIPYRGLAGAMNDVLGGRLDFVFSSIPSLGGTVADGKVRLLAAAGSKRLKSYPDIPSMAELGYPAVDVDLWFGLVAPLGTDDATVRKLNEIFVKATNAPELSERFKQLGVEIATGTPEEFKQALISDNARLGPFVKELTAKPK